MINNGVTLDQIKKGVSCLKQDTRPAYSAIVCYVQLLLNRSGFHCGYADGKYGSLTESAVRHFQMVNDLQVNGVINAETLNRLEVRSLIDLSNASATEKSCIIVEAALSKVGTPYDKMDCSQLTRYAYAKVGVPLPRTSVAQAKFCYDNKYLIEKSQLTSGDLIFWSKACKCGRWNEIHHTGIYIGNGEIIDSSSAAGRVVQRNIWGENDSVWELRFYAKINK